MTATAIFVGIDIAKADFVVARRPDGTSWTATNDPEGIAATVTRLRALAKFSRFPGLYLYHCHILEHEDGGMMRNFRIT